MARIRFKGRTWPTAVGLALAALAIGALFGSFRDGSAAIAAKPINQTPPTIAGTAQQGEMLTAGNGTWTGTTPLTYTYQWNRCDSAGKNCKPITGATLNTYDVQKADVGSTLTVTVQGTNADGNDVETSKPTAVVTTTPPATGCPGGTGTIAIADLSPPAHLAIDPGQATPGIITPGTRTLQLKFTITACGGRPVQGALVYATAVPYNQYSIPPEPTTDANGVAVLTMDQLTGFPASGKLAQLTVFVRARKDGEDILAGISARRLVAFPVNLK
jgi:hypothetical protein